MSLKQWLDPPSKDPVERPTTPLVIVLERGRMEEADIAKALAGNAGAQWYQALVSKIESMREDNLLEASRAASAGNELAMAGGLNVYEAFSALLQELDGYVKLQEDK